MGQTSQNRAPLYAAVHILDISYPADRPYTYRLEPGAEDEIVPGCFVSVPFGGGNRERIGYVSSVFSEDEASFVPGSCKTVRNRISREFTLSEEQRALCTFLCEMTFCTVGDAARTLIPPGVLNRLVESYVLSGNPEDPAIGNGETARSLIRMLSEEKSVRRERLGQSGASWMREAERLVRLGVLSRRTDIRPDDEPPKEGFARALLPPETLQRLAEGDPAARKACSFRRRADRFSAVLSALAGASGGERERSFSEILELRPELDRAAVAETVRELAADGILSVRYGDPLPEKREAAPVTEPSGRVTLNPEQREALETLQELSSRDAASAALLYGVTGSGKSLVIRSIAESVIASGKQVILLVPEIGLTPQSVAVYCSYFGDRAAVVHSGLSAGERIAVWRKAKKGELDLVIGTRSAVFAPFERLGLIVIDEEQEHTYKSDQSPRYHARDVARFRCAASKALLLLASATPSFESYRKAETGAYTLIRLTERYGGAALPDVVLDDIRGEISRDGCEPLGKTLSRYLTDTVRKGEQAVFFLNRRGYNKYVSCLSCRQAVFCEHCSIPMTLHNGKAKEEGESGGPGEIAGTLVCHYCGARKQPPALCPTCGSPHLQAFGYGTQRVEEELAERFPAVRTLRMDTDSTQGRDAYERILQKFRNREADLLLGTQMVTKGHDFPGVTLVGVIAADALLSLDDFRASERTFALLTQVIGRAGRADRPGVAVIQTYRPENEVFRLAAKQDYEAFYRKHIGFRKEMMYPPFCDMVLFSFSGKEEREVSAAAKQLAEQVARETARSGRFSGIGLSMFGPFEAPVYRVREQYRVQIVLKCRLNRETRTLLAYLLKSAGGSGRVTVSLDCNPTNL